MPTHASTSLPRLILFSGLGVDEALFAEQRCLPAKLELPRWLKPNEDDSLPSYGRRMAERIDPPADEPLFLGGVSFGAMIAFEVARHLDPRPRGVFMIAGARTGKALSPLIQLAAAATARSPDPLIHLALAGAPLLMRLMGRVPRRERNILMGLLDRSDLDLLRFGGRAIPPWTAPNDLGVPVHHIHGSDDRIIPVDQVSPDVIVPGGGHVVNLTHPKIVNAFIAARLSG